MSPSTVRAGVVGATGYVGAELVSLLNDHPGFELSHLTSRTFSGESFSSVYPRYSEEIETELSPFETERLETLDLVFLAVPHTVSMGIVSEIDLAETSVVDLAADYRFHDSDRFETVYETSHDDPGRVKTSVYGLAEHNGQSVRRASLVANPGCYATSVLVPLVELVKEKSVVGPAYVDAKSGISGAGREPSPANTFVNCNEEIKPYKAGKHRHEPEIHAHLPGDDLKPVFVPHVIPVDRGIESAIYLRPAPGSGPAQVTNCLREFAADHPLLRFRDEPAGIKAVSRTPYCDFSVSEKNGRVLIFSFIDNLLKGAASQAVQNANLMFDFSVTTGLVS